MGWLDYQSANSTLQTFDKQKAANDLGAAKESSRNDQKKEPEQSSSSLLENPNLSTKAQLEGEKNKAKKEQKLNPPPKNDLTRVSLGRLSVLLILAVGVDLSAFIAGIIVLGFIINWAMLAVIVLYFFFGVLTQAPKKMRSLQYIKQIFSFKVENLAISTTFITSIVESIPVLGDWIPGWTVWAIGMFALIRKIESDERKEYQTKVKAYQESQKKKK